MPLWQRTSGDACVALATHYRLLVLLFSVQVQVRPLLSQLVCTFFSSLQQEISFEVVLASHVSVSVKAKI